MTRLTRRLVRELPETVFEQGKHRPLVLILEPNGLAGFRLKGTRRVYYLPGSALWWTAVKAHVLAQKRERAKERKQRKRSLKK